MGEVTKPLGFGLIGISYIIEEAYKKYHIEHKKRCLK
jgi:hypothetical protein